MKLFYEQQTLVKYKVQLKSKFKSVTAKSMQIWLKTCLMVKQSRITY
jgi:hypothetical protein